MTQDTSRSRRGFAVALFLVVPLLLSGIATDHARAGVATRNRDRMLRLQNQVRAERDREALQLDEQLSRYALRHSEAMAEAGYLFHTENLGAKLKGRDWSMGGENVGVASSLTDLLASFMDSRPHRRNILRMGFDNTAIGIVESDGRLWVTLIFYG